MKDKKSILVTGAGGFVGSHLCKKLIQMGYLVFGLSPKKNIENIKYLRNNKNFHFEKGDIRNIDFLNKIIKKNKIKIIFHLAAVLPDSFNLKDPFLLFSVNSQGTLNILNAAFKNNIEKFIYSSTMSVYSEPPLFLPVNEEHPTWPSTIYGATKLTGELFCKTYSNMMDVTILRYGGVYGKGQHKQNAMYRFIDQALKNRPITIHGSGSQTTDFVYIDDVVKGTILGMQKQKPGIYNIGSGKECSIKNLAKKIIILTGSKSKIILTGRDTNRPFRFFLDIKKAKKVLGFSPLLLEKGLLKYILEFKNNKI